MNDRREESVNMSRRVSELLREAADRLDEMERSSPPGTASCMSSVTSAISSATSAISSGTPRGRGGIHHPVEASPPGTASSISSATSAISSGTPIGRGGLHHPVDAEVSRLFSAYNNQTRSRRQPRHSQTNQLVTYTHTFCCLGRKDTAIVPSRVGKEHLQRVGLGERRLNFRGNQENSEEFVEFILTSYPKLREAGGFEMIKISGTTRSRHLVSIPCPNQGYCVKYLKDPSVMINHATLYIRPLQRNLSMENEVDNSVAQTGPLTSCIHCGEQLPFAQIRTHSDACSSRSQVEREVENDRENGAAAPRASGTSDTTLQHQVVDLLMAESLETGSDEAASSSGTSAASGPVYILDAWVTEPNPGKAVELFTHTTLDSNKDKDPLAFTLSLRDSIVERNRAIMLFYKMPRVEWANPLHCRLIGDSAIGKGVNRYVLSTVMEQLQNGFLLDEEKEIKTLLFEGQRDHLIPSTSQTLLESDFFVVAGRMIGHCFLNGGPHFTGLSPAIMHVLFGGEQETATITLSDCVDQDVRDVIELLEGTIELTEEDKTKVLSLALPWDLPGVTMDNRVWLKEKILHAVLGRTMKQVKQMRRGLKDTGVLEFLSSRPDTVPVLFPRAIDMEITPQMILDKIVWPLDEDMDEDVFSIEEQCQVLNFLRTFIEAGSSEVLKSLLTFWTGWDVICSSLHVEIVDCDLPQSSTCFFTLKLSKNCKKYDDFHRDLIASISSSYSGFGQF